MNLLERLVAGLIGTVVVTATVLSAAQTLTVPRATPLWITRAVFAATGLVFAPARSLTDYYRRDRLLALYAPMSLLMLPAMWLVLVLIGFALIFFAVGASLPDAFLESGSSLLTLGFRTPSGPWPTAAVFLEAALGLGLVALLVSYLPSIYGSYSRREMLVTALETRAGNPPSAAKLLVRLSLIQGLNDLDAFWAQWANWFADIEETHSTAPSLVFFRSPQPDRSWVTAAGAVLDAAALICSAAEYGPQPAAELCIRSGYLSLRRVGDFFSMPYDSTPSPTDPVHVERYEFDVACQQLEDAGVRVRKDLERAWHDFAGWRVNYDQVLLQFASLTQSPKAPWSGDRPIDFNRTPLTRWKL